MDLELYKPDHPNRLSWQFPRLVNAGLPVPETFFIHLAESLDGAKCFPPPKMLEDLIERIRAGIGTIGLPSFLRTDFYAARKLFDRSCYLASEDRGAIKTNVLNLAADTVVMERGPLDTFCLRAFLAPGAMFTAYPGRLPIGKEARAFVEKGKLVHLQKRHLEHELTECEPIDFWRNHLSKLTLTRYDKRSVGQLAVEAARACENPMGEMCVDLYSSGGKWYILDLQLSSGEMKYHDVKEDA